MADNIKCRAMLLDEETGAPIGEANIVTRADCVTFTDGETFQDKLDSGELQGPKGDPGIPGSVIYKVEGEPGAELGAVGDWAMDPGTGDVYVKEESAWKKRGNLTGPQGPQGETGPKGDDGIALVGTSAETARRVRMMFQPVE